MVKTIALISFLFLTVISNAQEEGAYYVSKDLSTWSTAAFELKINKQWSFTLSEQFRLETNSSELDNFFTEIETKYKFDSGLSIGGGYRFIRDKTKNTGLVDWEQRFQADISYGFKYKEFAFDFRLRAQSKDDLGENRTDDGDYARRALRFKMEAKYNIKNWKLDPVISAEIFRENGKYVQANFSKFRATIGNSYDLKKAGEISVFYRFEKDLNTNYPLTNYIFGLKYKFTYKMY